MNCWICLVTLSGQPGSRTCWLTVLNLLRTSSQSCSTRSEACRSSPRLRRNDGVHPPPPWRPPSSSSFSSSSSSSSALTCHHPAISHPFVFIFFPSAPSSAGTSAHSFTPLLFPSLVAWIHPYESFFLKLLGKKEKFLKNLLLLGEIDNMRFI